MNKFLQLLSSKNRSVLVPVVWFVKDMKSNLGTAGIRIHDLRIRNRTLYPWTTLLPPLLLLQAVKPQLLYAVRRVRV